VISVPPSCTLWSKKPFAPTAQYTPPYRHTKLLSASHPIKTKNIHHNQLPSVISAPPSCTLWLKKPFAPTAQYTPPYRHTKLLSASHPLINGNIHHTEIPLSSLCLGSFVSLSPSCTLWSKKPFAPTAHYIEIPLRPPCLLRELCGKKNKFTNLLLQTNTNLTKV
jgi:hypothetical protein